MHHARGLLAEKTKSVLIPIGSCARAMPPCAANCARPQEACFQKIKTLAGRIFTFLHAVSAFVATKSSSGVGTLRDTDLVPRFTPNRPGRRLPSC